MNLRHVTEEDLQQMIANRDRGRGGVVGTRSQYTKADCQSLVVSERNQAVEKRAGSNPAPSPTIQTFFVPGPLPGANDIIRKHWRVYSRLKADWGLTCARCIMIAKLKPVRACTIAYHWVEPLPRRGHIRDRDNIRFGAKFVNDALVSHGILLDDGPDGVVSMTDSFTYDGETPGVHVTITEVQV
jgi:hypothetical protein